MTHCLVSDSGSMDNNDPFGERVFNERETVSCHDINPAFDNLVGLRRRTRKCTRNCRMIRMFTRKLLTALKKVMTNKPLWSPQFYTMHRTVPRLSKFLK